MVIRLGIDREGGGVLLARLLQQTTDVEPEVVGGVAGRDGASSRARQAA